MDGESHTSCWQLRAVNTVVAGKWLGYLRADLDRTLRVQIQSHMATRSRQTGGANK